MRVQKKWTAVLPDCETPAVPDEWCSGPFRTSKQISAESSNVQFVSIAKYPLNGWNDKLFPKRLTVYVQEAPPGKQQCSARTRSRGHVRPSVTRKRFVG